MINVDKNHLSALHEILTDIANEDNLNNLVTDSDIDHRIDLLGVRLPAGSKERAREAMNYRHDALLANQQFHFHEETPTKVPDESNEVPESYRQAVAELQQAINKAQQEVGKEVKNASLENIEKAIAHLEPYFKSTKEEDKLA